MRYDCLIAMVRVPSPQDPRAEQLMDDLEKKDQEIEKLKTTISQWEVSIAALNVSIGALIEFFSDFRFRFKKCFTRPMLKT